MVTTVMEILWAPLLAGLGVLVGWWLRHWAETSARSLSNVSVHQNRFTDDLDTGDAGSGNHGQDVHATGLSNRVTETANAIDHRPNDHGDPLHGLSGRAPFVDDVHRRVAEFKRAGLPVSVLLMRIDNLDEIVDGRGAQGAQEVLVAMSRFLKATLREMDHVARFDDRTFGVVLPNADDQVARGVTDRLREVVSSYRLTSANGELIIAVSVEAAQVQENESAAELLHCAENALDGDTNKFCHVFRATQAD